MPMLRFVLLLSLFLMVGFFSTGQTFVCPGNPVQQQTVAFHLANEVFIYFENKTTDTLRLKWRRLEFHKPDEWGMALCDWGNCYTGVPTSGTMNFLPPHEKAYLKLIVQPGSTPGQSWLWFRVWNAALENDFADVYFSLHTPGTSAAPLVNTPVAQVFPNPVSDVLYFSHALPVAQPYFLTDANGIGMYHGISAPNEVKALTMSHLPAGIYHLWCGRKSFPVVKL